MSLGSAVSLSYIMKIISSSYSLPKTHTHTHTPKSNQTKNPKTTKKNPAKPDKLNKISLVFVMLTSPTFFPSIFTDPRGA